jgi:hypothetical protein
MRLSRLFFGGLVAILAFHLQAAQASDYPLARIHFLGTSQFSANTNSERLARIWTLPESLQLRAQTLEKLSRWPEKFLDGQSFSNRFALIRPLLDDVVQSESVLEWRGLPDGQSQLVLAIQLSDERARLWDTNLWQFLHASNIASPPDQVRMASEGKWFLLGIGSPKLPLFSNVLSRIRRDGRPGPALKTNWLEADIDWPKLQPWLPLSNSWLKLARTEIQLNNRDEYLRTTVRAFYPKAIGWKFEPWQVPTNLVRSPLISFSASQNLAALANDVPLFRRAQLNPLASQLYLWSRPDVPFQSLMAVLAKDAGKTLQRLGVLWPATFNADVKAHFTGEIFWSTNQHEILWRGLPVIVPFLAAMKDKSGEFFVGGLFPEIPGTNPPPAELLGQIMGRTNLVYYQWEVTQNRLMQWRVLDQLRLIAVPLAGGPNSGPENVSFVSMPEQKWSAALAPLLGNTVTEITLTAPDQLLLVRKSHSGFTGFELMQLAKWLNRPDFPSPIFPRPKR